VAEREHVVCDVKAVVKEDGGDGRHLERMVSGAVHIEK
jgi:hypothetical protein